MEYSSVILPGPVRLDPDRMAASSAAFAGGVDEFRSVHRARSSAGTKAGGRRRTAAGAALTAR